MLKVSLRSPQTSIIDHFEHFGQSRTQQFAVLPQYRQSRSPLFRLSGTASAQPRRRRAPVARLAGTCPAPRSTLPETPRLGPAASGARRAPPGTASPPAIFGARSGAELRPAGAGPGKTRAAMAAGVDGGDAAGARQHVFLIPGKHAPRAEQWRAGPGPRLRGGGLGGAALPVPRPCALPGRPAHCPGPETGFLPSCPALHHGSTRPMAGQARCADPEEAQRGSERPSAASGPCGCWVSGVRCPPWG